MQGGGYKLEFLISRALRKKIICEFYISGFDTFVLDRKTIKEGTKQARKMLSLDRKMQECFHVIYLDNTAPARFSALAGLKLSDLHYSVIPLVVKERGVAKLKYYAGEKDAFNIVWWGTYIPLHGLDKLVLAVELLCKENRNVHLYIMGDSDERAIPYLKLIEERNLHHAVTVRNDYSFRNGRLEDFIINNCDLAVGAFGDSEKARTAPVNKAIEAVSMRIPVITQDSIAFQEFFPDDDSTIAYTANDVHSIKENIVRVMNLPSEEIQRRVKNSYDIYKKFFSPESACRLYESLLNKLI